MGLNFPHSMMNYPGQGMNDAYYWNGNNMDRFGMLPPNHNVPYNYSFGPGDHMMLGKNMPLLNHSGMSGMKGYSQVNTPNKNKPFSVPEPLLKDDKLKPIVQKQLFNNNFNNPNDKR